MDVTNMEKLEGCAAQVALRCDEIS